MKTLRNSLFLILSVIIFSSFTSASVFGQTSDLPDSSIPPLSVKTELPLYDQGGVIVVSGLVKNPDENNVNAITLRILDEDGNIVTVDQFMPQEDGSFAKTYLATGP